MIRRWQIYLSMSFFGLILLIGIVSQVSFSVALGRAVGWSIAVLVLVVINTQVVLAILDQNIREQAAGLDITLPEEQVRASEDKSTPRPANMMGSQQIEKDIEDMVKNDPVRVADLTRKMGLD